MNTLFIQIICFIVLFVVLVFCFVSIDEWRIRRRMNNNIKKWKKDVEDSDKKNYRRKDN